MKETQASKTQKKNENFSQKDRENTRQSNQSNEKNQQPKSSPKA